MPCCIEKHCPAFFTKHLIFDLFLLRATIDWRLPLPRIVGKRRVRGGGFSASWTWGGFHSRLRNFTQAADLLNLHRGNSHILRTKKTKCWLQIQNKSKTISRGEIPWEWLGSRYVSHQAENLSRPLIRDPEIATEVNPFLLWLCGKGAAYPMCHAERNNS